MKSWFLWFHCFLLPRLLDSLVCYSCTATMSSAVDESAQIAMRIFLESTYYLPAVHRYCAMENDVEFKSIPTSQCNANDKCVKISADGNGLQFVIRGCESQIYKPNIGVHDVGCRAGASPSLCYCEENLCNSIYKSLPSVFTFLSLTALYCIL
ncbi:unnamed protein product [Bursaphelenchus xylophilus]|uniref:(pine wood nematode) hypothetical protein n=1 Tax=Bursaphelenchus xylophilus TaxID=6326 RepID=A0A1I7SWE4_BURXY|nr:unnamed protein product [Bursaphelenchus xylophilus]CAG9099276.1 unnamed protein product [Bursaphelenchus xylophilus]